MGEVSPLREFVRGDGTPFLRSGGTLHHLILVLIDDGLAHFWDEQGYSPYSRIFQSEAATALSRNK